MALFWASAGASFSRKTTRKPSFWAWLENLQLEDKLTEVSVKNEWNLNPQILRRVHVVEHFNTSGIVVFYQLVMLVCAKITALYVSLLPCMYPWYVLLQTSLSFKKMRQAWFSVCSFRFLGALRGCIKFGSLHAFLSFKKMHQAWFLLRRCAKLGCLYVPSVFRSYLNYCSRAPLCIYLTLTVMLCVFLLCDLTMMLGVFLSNAFWDQLHHGERSCNR